MNELAENLNPYELPQWEHPADYGGFSPDGDFVIYGRNRDSTILENSNYELIMAELEKHAETLPEHPDGEPYVYDFSANHWAVGWVETLLIRQDSPDSLQALASEILGALSDYPVYDESDYSERQYNAIYEYWQNLSMSDRIELCSDNDTSIFAARRDDDISESVFYALMDSELAY
jgi:hypothetical protein